MLFVALLHAASAGMHYATRGLLHCRLELPCHSASLDEISSRARGKHAGRRRDRCRTHLLHAVLLRRIPLRRVLLRSSPGLGPTYRCPDSVFRLQRLNGTAEPQVEASCTRRTRPRSTKRPGLASERTRSDPNADALSQSRPQASLSPCMHHHGFLDSERLTFQFKGCLTIYNHLQLCAGSPTGFSSPAEPSQIHQSWYSTELGYMASSRIVARCCKDVVGICSGVCRCKVDWRANAL